MSDNRPIGVMDSGMGGISVLKELMAHMPSERYIFWGDNKNAPYGGRSADEIKKLTCDIVDRLLLRDVKAVVIACNTATSAAATHLREKLTIPVLGLEPALKPAAGYAGDGCVAVLATEATLKLEKYQRLLEKYGRNTVNIPCPELVRFVEMGDTGSERLKAYINERLKAYDCRDVKAVVLGCTHFVWLREAVKAVLPDAEIFDGNEGLARHMKDMLGRMDLLCEGGDGGYELHTTSDDPEMLLRMEEYMNKQN